MDLLKDLAVIPHPFVHVGITGYPESHPAIHDDVTIQSMWDKRTYATHIVSNMTFDPKLVTAWVGRLRRRGVALPVLVGLPGPVETASSSPWAPGSGSGSRCASSPSRSGR